MMTRAAFAGALTASDPARREAATINFNVFIFPSLVYTRAGARRTGLISIAR
jgi:hypothetical protein